MGSFVKPKTRMNTLFAIVLVIVAATAYAEYCDHDSDCTLTVCGSNFRVDCYKYGGGDQVCTCLPTSGGSSGSGGDFKCSSPDACQNKYGNCNHGDHRWHCYDQRCRCSFFG